MCPIFSTGISDTVPRRFLLQTGSNTIFITRHHYNHFPTLSLEHLNLVLDCPTSPTLLSYSNLNPNYLGKGCPIYFSNNLFTYLPFVSPETQFCLELAML
jgi:hypothetical protein